MIALTGAGLYFQAAGHAIGTGTGTGTGTAEVLAATTGTTVAAVAIAGIEGLTTREPPPRVAVVAGGIVGAFLAWGGLLASTRATLGPVTALAEVAVALLVALIVIFFW